MMKKVKNLNVFRDIERLRRNNNSMSILGRILVKDELRTIRL